MRIEIRTKNTLANKRYSHINSLSSNLLIIFNPLSPLAVPYKMIYRIIKFYSRVLLLIIPVMLTKIDPKKPTLLEMRIVWLFLDARS